VLLDETCPMRFIAFGRVNRSVGRLALCTIDRYEFRTAARAAKANVTVRNDSMLERYAAETMKLQAAC